MAHSTGTLPTGTAVQNTDKLELAALIARDTALIGNVVSSANAADRSAGKLIGDVAKLAQSIMELHEAGTWERTIDGTTGKLYSSAKAFYASLIGPSADGTDTNRFPHLHKVVRTELVELLMDGGKLSGIGVNELAAIIGCNPAQITRTVAAINAKPAEPVDLDKVAADARQAAIESGADDKAADYAAEQARAEAKRAAEAPAPEMSADDKAAEAKRVADAEAKRVNKAHRTLVNAVSEVNDVFHLMTDEQRAEIRKAIGELDSAMGAFQTGLDKAKAPAAKRTTVKPGPRTTGNKAS